MLGAWWAGPLDARKSSPLDGLPLRREKLTLHRSTLTLTLPYIVEAINEKLLYIFGACNALSIPIGMCSPRIFQAQRTNKRSQYGRCTRSLTSAR